MFKAFVSPLAPNDLLATVRALSDPDEIDPGAATFFPGSQALVGRFTASHFVLQQRPRLPWGLWLLSPAAWFRPFLSGTVRPHGQGSELQLEGGASIAAKVIWALIFLGTAAVGGVFTVFSYPTNISFDPGHSGARFLAGLVLTGLVQGLLLAMPALGWWLTRHDLARMANQLVQQLSLREVSYRQLWQEPQPVVPTGSG
ncbi:MAG TPA: hypothetical protein VGD78_22340 [Chthoniobacterales bacterium]